MRKAICPVSKGLPWYRTLSRIVGVVAGLLLVVSAGVYAGPRQTQPAPASSPASIPAARFAKNVVIITIDREIDATMARSVKRRLETAVENKADAVVFELDTPGGALDAVLDISEMIKTSPISNTVAWVHNKAYSGGAIIALACREIVVSSVARLGDAAPIRRASPFARGGPIQSLSETERQKILAPLLADLVDSARRRGYDEKLVQGMVTIGVELWMVENVKTGEKLFIDRAEHEMLFGEPPAAEPLALASAAPLPSAPDAAPPATTGADRVPAAQPTAPAAAPASPTDFIPATPTIMEDTSRTASLALTVASRRPHLTPADAGQWRKIEKVSDGNTIFTFTESQLLRYGLASQEIKTDDELKAFFGATNMRRLDQSWSETMVVFLTNIIVRGLLIVIFLVALFIEMTHPGIMIPGLVAAAAFILLVAPPLLNNMASWWEIAAMIVGVGLLLLEIFVLPGFGVCGVAGIIFFLAGLVGTFIGAGGLFPGSSSGNPELMSGVTTVVLSVATSFVLMWFVSKHFGSLPLLNKLVLRDEVSGEDSSGGLLAAMGPAKAGAISPGDIGVTLTPLRPAGRVQIGDEIVDVVSDFGFIRAGARVRVVRLDPFRVAVEPIQEADGESDAAEAGSGSGDEGQPA